MTKKSIVSRLKGSTNLSPKEVADLKDRGIKNTDDLWKALGNDFDRGIEELADSIRLSPKRLTRLLVSQAVADIESGKGSWFKRHWPELILIIGMGALVLLALRAAGIASFPSALKWNERFIFASRNMDKDQVVQAGDLYVALLPSRDNYFKSKQEIVGLILARPVTRHKPVQFEDLLRLQAVAVKDVELGKLLTKDDVALKWTAYQKEAITQTDLVIGRKACRAMRSDDVILCGFIGDCGVSSQ